jgi:mono/diheme cytochrome c family protein
LTEIPEHLLRRSRERRAALGQGGDAGSGGDGGAGSEGASALPARADAPARAPAAAAASRAPALIEEPAVVMPVYVAPTGPHKLRVPIWVMPVLAAIPLWAFFFPAAFSNHQKAAVTDPITIGKQVYLSSCSTCHGTNGEGGVGPALHGGQAALTFPNVADHIAWVKSGSMGIAKNAPYGDPNRTGGQHIAAKNDMPAFGATLSATQIQDVVAYERTKL